MAEVPRGVGPTERVVCGLSGGVDSAVCAALLARALGPRVVCVFVDTGLLRRNERAAVVEGFGQRTSAEVRGVGAEATFLKALAGGARPRGKGGGDRPAGKAVADRPCVHRCLPRGGPVD